MNGPIDPVATVALVSDPAEILRFVESPQSTSPMSPSRKSPALRARAPSSSRASPRSLASLACRAAQSLLANMSEIVPLIARANGFTERQAEFAIDGALGPLRVETFETLWRNQGLPMPFDMVADAGVDAGVDSLSCGDRAVDGPKRTPSESTLPDLTLVVGGGSIPQPNLQAVIAAMMVSRRVIYRPSRLDRALVPLLLGRMDELAQKGDDAPGEEPYRVSGHVLCATWPRENKETSARIARAADSIVVFGDEPTQEFFRNRAKPSASVYSYGPRISFAVVDLDVHTLRGGGENQAEAEAKIDGIVRHLAPKVGSKVWPKVWTDIWAYNQQGCLSPMALYLVGGPRGAAEAVFEALARRFAASEGSSEALSETSLGPSSSIPAHAAARIHALRRVYAMDPRRRRRMSASREIPGWTLLWDEAEPELTPLPGFATLRVSPVSDWAALLDAVRPCAGRLQAMGVWPGSDGDARAGAQEVNRAVPGDAYRALEKMGLSRVCKLGEMQCPPLDWLHDGNPFFPI